MALRTLDVPVFDADDHVLFGSGFPHPEGLADPVSYVDELEGLTEESVRKIMGGNLARLMNVDGAVR